MLASDMYGWSIHDASLSRRCSNGLKPRAPRSLNAHLHAVRMERGVRVDIGSARHVYNRNHNNIRPIHTIFLM
jgi:hypothetical protein